MSNISCPNYDMTSGGLQSDPDLGEVVASLGLASNTSFFARDGQTRSIYRLAAIRPAVSRD